MDLTTNEISRIIQEALGKTKLTKYSVKQFSESAHISRSTFYRQYQKIEEIYSVYIRINFSRVLSAGESDSDYQKYQQITELMKKDQIIFENIYNLTTQRMLLQDTFFGIFNDYLKQKYQKIDLFSDHALGLLSQSLALTLVSWIDSGFKKSTDEITKDLFRVTAVAENVKDLLI